MTTLRMAGFLCIALLGVTWQALAPSRSPGVPTPDAPAPCAAPLADEIGLDCAHLATSWLGASFLDLDSRVSQQATDAHAVFETINAGPTTADDLARVPEPASLLLLALSCAALASRRTHTGVRSRNPA